MFIENLNLKNIQRKNVDIKVSTAGLYITLAYVFQSPAELDICCPDWDLVRGLLQPLNNNVKLALNMQTEKQSVNIFRDLGIIEVCELFAFGSSRAEMTIGKRFEDQKHYNDINLRFWLPITPVSSPGGVEINRDRYFQLDIQSTITTDVQMGISAIDGFAVSRNLYKVDQVHGHTDQIFTTSLAGISFIALPVDKVSVLRLTSSLNRIVELEESEISMLANITSDDIYIVNGNIVRSLFLNPIDVSSAIQSETIFSSDDHMILVSSQSIY